MCVRYRVRDAAGERIVWLTQPICVMMSLGFVDDFVCLDGMAYRDALLMMVPRVNRES